MTITTYEGLYLAHAYPAVEPEVECSGSPDGWHCPHWYDDEGCCFCI